MKKNARRKRYPPHKIRTYRVYGRFLRTRDEDRHIEVWDGQARSLTVAARRGISAIMRRPNVKRLRHQQVNFTVEIAGPLGV